jgi:UDP-N-acetylmuramoyl-L-alanyl-D-glutamate--2,6-diaminopimelate ligase
MELREVLAAVDVAEWIGADRTEIERLDYDSRRVQPGSLFFCVRGERRDGHEFAATAIEGGAAALVVERALDIPLPQARVADARAAMAPAAVAFFGDPTAELRVAGVTGTNGKTTTAFLVRHILERTGAQTGLLGTIKQVVGGVEEAVERTTPEAIDLQATFRAMLDAGDRACLMEVSSHAMELRRADGIRFTVAAFTNLTQDHLDFHSDMEAYYLAKRRLFGSPDGAEASSMLRSPESAVVNLDDPYGSRLIEELRTEGRVPLTTFSATGSGDADLRALEVSFDATGSRFTCAAPEGEAAVEVGLPGEFNVENALCALGIARALGVGIGEGAVALRDAERVPGRLEPIDEGQGFAVLVDYAHTPDSLENVLRAARRLTEGRLITVFGAGGDRDRDKRPLMGENAARLSDLAVVTSDNPRSEPPDAIIAEIVAGIEDRGGVEIEPDRRAAIAMAVGRAAPGDTVLIAGKGHEQGQEFEAGRKLPFDDRTVAREELRRLAGAGRSA